MSIEYFSNILGYSFQFMDKPKVPVHHEYKKEYFGTLREAWFALNENNMSKLFKTLEIDGFTKREIEAKRCYEADFLLI